MYIYIYVYILVIRCQASGLFVAALSFQQVFSLAEDVRLAAVSTGRGGKNMGDAGKSLRHSCDPKQ